MDCSLAASSVHGILQARILEWVAIPLSSWPRHQTWVSCIAGRLFPDCSHHSKPQLKWPNNLLIDIAQFTTKEVGKYLETQMVKNLPAMCETQVHFLGWEDPLEKGLSTHSSILAWRIPWTEEAGGLQSMGSQRVGHWVTKTHTHRLQDNTNTNSLNVQKNSKRYVLLWSYLLR